MFRLELGHECKMSDTIDYCNVLVIFRYSSIQIFLVYLKFWDPVSILYVNLPLNIEIYISKHKFT